MFVAMSLHTLVPVPLCVYASVLRERRCIGWWACRVKLIEHVALPLSGELLVLLTLYNFTSRATNKNECVNHNNDRKKYLASPKVQMIQKRSRV